MLRKQYCHTGIGKRKNSFLPLVIASLTSGFLWIGINNYPNRKTLTMVQRVGNSFAVRRRIFEEQKGTSDSGSDWHSAAAWIREEKTQRKSGASVGNSGRRAEPTVLPEPPLERLLQPTGQEQNLAFFQG